MIIRNSPTPLTRILKTLLHGGLEAADPDRVFKNALAKKNNHLWVSQMKFDLSQYKRVLCVGAGKASGHMALRLEQVLGKDVDRGTVIVPDGHGAQTKQVHIFEAHHPVPDWRGVSATKKIRNIVDSATKDDLLVVLLSGGASSLLCAPAPGLKLAEKQRTTGLLLRCGATIHEINTVRKHLSAIKGGQLALATSATILTLIISDVIGDELTTIGSGPTVPDPTTFHEAHSILKRHDIWGRVPQSIRYHLNQGTRGTIPETWKRRGRPPSHHHSIILANNQWAIDGLAKKAKQLGLRVCHFEAPLQGEARNVGGILGNIARDIRKFGNPIRPPACLIAGGEPTVTVRGRGKGGRAQECVLAAAPDLAGLPNLVLAGFGTDGTDGPTDATGAMVDGTTVQRAKENGLSIERMLKGHDSYNFFKRVGGHIITGPTKTNVNDIYLILAL